MSRHVAAALFLGLLCSVGIPSLAKEAAKPDATFTGHVGAVSSVAFSPDSKLLASGGEDRSVILWDLATGKQRTVLEGHLGSVSALAFSSAGALLASGGGEGSFDFDIRLWDVATGRIRRSLNGHQARVICITFSPDGKLLASCSSGGQTSNIKLWHVATGKLLANLHGHFANCVTFSADGTLLATAGETSIILWDMCLGLKKNAFDGFAEGVYGVAFAPDASSLAVGSGNAIVLCDPKTGRKIRTFKSAEFPIGPRFGPDGEVLAAATAPWAIKLWDVKTGKERTLLTAQDQIHAIAFSPDGTLVASGNRDMTVTVWRNPASKKPPRALARPATAAKETVAKLVSRAARAVRPTPRSTAQERNKAFQWFSDLGFRDIKDRKFVRVSTGDVSFGAGGARTNIAIHGFLLGEIGERFTVMTLDMEEKTFQKSAAEPPLRERTGFELADLKTHATTFVKTLRAPKRDWSPHWEKKLRPQTRAFVLAWACWRRGLDELAAALYDAGSGMPKGYGQYPDEPASRPLWALVADDLAGIELWRAGLAFGNRDVPRSQLLKQFENIIRRYPASPYHEDARIAIALLKQMIREDMDHAKVAAKPFDQLSNKEQIAELIFQLRDQDAIPSDRLAEPVSYDLPEQRRLGPSPAQKLLQIGFDAVPQLIEHLDDDRFTRSTVWNVYYFPNKILRANDHAVLILERIACRKFGGERELAGATKQRIQTWYADFQKKGEKKLLAEGVARGDQESYDQAMRLAEKYPDAALPAVVAGLKAAKDAATHEQLIVAAGKIKGDSVLPLLLAELRQGPTVIAKLNAATILHERGRREAVAAMIALWQHEGQQRWKSDAPSGLELVALFLAECGKVEAAGALAHDLHKRPVALRARVQACCAPGYCPTDDKASKLPMEVRHALQRVLIAALDDKDECYGVVTMGPERNAIDGPRLCDMVARGFKDAAPGGFSFDSHASIFERDRAIIGIKNVLRKSQGLAALPVPERKTIVEVPEEKLRELVAKVLEAQAANRKKHEAKLEDLGLGAVPGLLKIRKESTRGQEIALLDKLSRRLACIVVDAGFAEKSLKPDPPLASKLAAMKGKPFNPDPLLEMIRGYDKNLPKGVHALRFAVDRAENDTGVTVEMELFDEARAEGLGAFASFELTPEQREGRPYGWHCLLQINAGGKQLYAESGTSADLERFTKKHNDLRKALVEACSAAPNQQIYVRVLLVADFAKSLP